MDFAKEILEILETKFGENIAAHLYNIDKFKAEIIERELGQFGQAKAFILQQEEIQRKAELNKQQVAQAQFAAQKTATNLVDNIIKKSLDKKQAQFAAQKTATNLVDNIFKKSLGKIK